MVEGEEALPGNWNWLAGETSYGTDWLGKKKPVVLLTRRLLYNGLLIGATSRDYGAR